MNTEERRKQLLGKSVNDLVTMIIRYEEEMEESKEYRAVLGKIRNLATPVNERRGRGRPRKEAQCATPENI